MTIKKLNLKQNICAGDYESDLCTTHTHTHKLILFCRFCHTQQDMTKNKQRNG